MISLTPAARGYSNWELSADRANASRRELIAGGLAEGKVLRVVGMAATMSLKQHGADDAINRRITVLVLNKQTQEGIEHENAESNAMDIAQPDSLKQLAPSATAPASQTPEPSAAARSRRRQRQRRASQRRHPRR